MNDHERLRRLEETVTALQATQRPIAFSAMRNSPTGAQLLHDGSLVLREVDAASDDDAGDLEVRARKVGADIIIEVYDKSAGAWRTVTLS